MTIKKPEPKKPAAKSEGKAKTATVAPKKPSTKGVKALSPKAAPKAKVVKAKPATKSAPRNPNPKKLNNPQLRTIEPVKPSTDEVSADNDIAQALADGLSITEIAFVDTYLTCYNGMKAWMAIYPESSRLSAQSSSSTCLSRPKVAAYLAKRAKAAWERTTDSQDRLILMYMYQAYGDANELVEFRRESCRYCHGFNHLYHYTPNEMARARSKHEADKKKAFRDAKAEGKESEFVYEDFDEQGGLGFDPRIDPHEDCPECFGQGIGREFFKDTRKLSPAAQAMYAGLKVSKEGMEIKITSKEKAAEVLAKLLKLTEDSTNNNFIFDAQELGDKFASKMAAAHARMKEMQEKRGLTPRDDG